MKSTPRKLALVLALQAVLRSAPVWVAGAAALLPASAHAASGACAPSQAGCRPCAPDHHDCDWSLSGKRIDRSASLGVQAPAPNHERELASAASAVSTVQHCAAVLARAGVAGAALPFRISVDGVPLTDAAAIDPDLQRCTDVALERADIQIRFDPLKLAPELNAHAWPNAVARDASVAISAWSNYAAFIERAEIRIFAPGQSTQSEPLRVLPTVLGQTLHWQPAGLAFDEVFYLLRVYDARGRFDETRPKALALVDRARPPADADTPARELLAGYGENSLALRNIPLGGGTVTVNGRGLAPGEGVRFLGQPVPVDRNGAFAARQILPAGQHAVEVVLTDAQGGEARFVRNLNIAAQDWFYVGLADLTIGRNHSRGPVRIVRADANDQFAPRAYVDGRLALYLRGKIRGDWLLTASVDTREQGLDEMFSNFDARDPRSLLRRLDPNQYFPVYGDDSTTIDDAPTQGRLFVRLERGQGPDSSQFLWGNFHTSLTGTEFTRFNRALYGARIRLVSDASTSLGERSRRFELFAADPGTLQSREEFRGTGGSLYYLRQFDITAGSERVWVEVRDRDSGLVLSTRHLTHGQDYQINALQGRIMLARPLPSTAAAGTLVQGETGAGHPQFLVVTYEYSPNLREARDMVLGGRASVWINDHVQIGASGLRQDHAGQRQRLHGLDLTLRYRPGTYVKIEGARSVGVGSGTWVSNDGGFSFRALPGNGREADAQRIEAALDLAEVGLGVGALGFYHQHREAGFSAPGQITDEAVTQTGAHLRWQISPETELLAKVDASQAVSQERNQVELNLRQSLDANWRVSLGVRHDEMQTRRANASPTLSQNGERTDAVLRLDYDAPDGADWNAWGFVQATLQRDPGRMDNDRIGIGAERRISDRFRLGAEISDGDAGFGARLSGEWQVDDRTSLFSSYHLGPDRTDEGQRSRVGLFTTGARTRFGDAVSLFAEQRYQHGDGPSGLTHAFGLDYAPSDRWTYGLKLEAGSLHDPQSGDLERRAVGLSVGYRHEGVRWSSALELRDENAAVERQTWLMRNTLGYQINPDWRFLGRLDFSWSRSNDPGAHDGRFVEFVTGWAWRPVLNDRWNTLFKYTWHYNVPAAGQTGRNNPAADFAQRSHVLAIDTIYEVRPWLTLGGKLGLRTGYLRDLRTPDADWQRSSAWLGVLRADWHWVHEWDIVTELRYRSAELARDSQSGALVAVYRHLGRNFKLGLGYNFTDFSDDLTDLSWRSHGWFINLVGKF